MRYRQNITTAPAQVSWLRRRGSEMSLLTTNQLVFSLDSRLAVRHTSQDNNWGLVLQSAQATTRISGREIFLPVACRNHSILTVPDIIVKWRQERDSGSYLCQLNTHPPATLLTRLIVIVPSLQTVDDQGRPVSEKYFKPGTTILLRCLVTNYRPDFPAPLWRREEGVVTDSERTRWAECGFPKVTELHGGRLQD